MMGKIHSFTASSSSGFGLSPIMREKFNRLALWMTKCGSLNQRDKPKHKFADG